MLACGLMATHCGKLDPIVTSLRDSLNYNNSHLNTASRFPNAFASTEFSDSPVGRLRIVFPILENTWKGSVTVPISHSLSMGEVNQSVDLLTFRPSSSRKMGQMLFTDHGLHWPPLSSQTEHPYPRAFALSSPSVWNSLWFILLFQASAQ